MPEGNPPAQHAQVAEEVERRAERERTRNPPAYPSVEWTASVAPRRPGSALPALPAVRDDESDQISIAYSRTSAAAPAYGSAALKPITAANAAEMSIVPRMKRRRPNRMDSSLPQTLAPTPTRPMTPATGAGPAGGPAGPGVGGAD